MVALQHEYVRTGRVGVHVYSRTGMVSMCTARQAMWVCNMCMSGHGGCATRVRQDREGGCATYVQQDMGVVHRLCSAALVQPLCSMKGEGSRHLYSRTERVDVQHCTS